MSGHTASASRAGSRPRGRSARCSTSAATHVLVARAVSDGDDLQLVLRPGNGAGRQRLGIADLQPEQDYHLAGAVQSAVTADATGKASIDVDLDGRAEVRVTPRS